MSDDAPELDDAAIAAYLSAVEALAGAGTDLTAYELERAGWFEGLGFTDLQARALATARDGAGQRVTVHDVRSALERGCDHATAFEIFT